MAKCVECGERFNVNEAREEYNDYFSDAGILYDEQFDNQNCCASCAISITEGYMNAGSAMSMVNGDEDYDQDFVDRWL